MFSVLNQFVVLEAFVVYIPVQVSVIHQGGQCVVSSTSL